MRARAFLAVISLTAAVSIARTSGADEGGLAPLRAEVTSLTLRVGEVRNRERHVAPALRRESERILSMVEERRAALSVRLDLLELLGHADHVDDDTLRQMQSSYATASKLLGTVESWYQPR